MNKRQAKKAKRLEDFGRVRDLHIATKATELIEV